VGAHELWSTTAIRSRAIALARLSLIGGSCRLTDYLEVMPGDALSATLARSRLRGDLYWFPRSPFMANQRTL